MQLPAERARHSSPARTEGAAVGRDEFMDLSSVEIGRQAGRSRMKARHVLASCAAGTLFVSLAIVGCSPTGGNPLLPQGPTTGGATSTQADGSGGVTGNGGNRGSGGSARVGTGGSSGNGGTTSSGGSKGSGGSSHPATGGSDGAGGSSTGRSDAGPSRDGSTGSSRDASAGRDTGTTTQRDTSTSTRDARSVQQRDTGGFGGVSRRD